MYAAKNIYFRDLITDLYKRKVLVILFVIACTLGFSFLGYRKIGSQKALTEEQQEEIDTYNERLAEYDEIIADTLESLTLVEKQISELQEYVDNSIYMQIDPQNIQVSSVQYGIVTEGNVGNIYNALALYINEGGLKDALAEEYADLDVEYWREIITCSLGGNVMNITVYHYDAEQAQQIMDIIKKRLTDQIPAISEVQGAFTLQETGSSNHVKSDVNVVNTQNGNLNNLKNYISNRGDFNNRLLSQENSKSSYIENNTPEIMEAASVNGRTLVVKYAVAGFLFGIVLPCVCFILSYILGNRIRSKEHLQEYGLAVLGSCRSGGKHYPELERSVLDLKLVAEKNSWKSIFLSGLNETEPVKKAVSEYADALKKAEIQTAEGFHLDENAADLQSLAEMKNCILFLQLKKTTYPQLEAQLNLCRKFGFAVWGCVIIG